MTLTAASCNRFVGNVPGSALPEPKSYCICAMFVYRCHTNLRNYDIASNWFRSQVLGPLDLVQLGMLRLFIVSGHSAIDIGQRRCCRSEEVGYAQRKIFECVDSRTKIKVFERGLLGFVWSRLAAVVG